MPAKSASSRSVLVRSTQRWPITGRTLAPRRSRALVKVFGDLVRACRDLLFAVEFGQPSANQASITSSKVASRARLGPGSRDCARSARSSSRSAWESEFHLATGAVGKSHPGHPSLRPLVPTHGGPLSHPSIPLDVASEPKATLNLATLTRGRGTSLAVPPLTCGFPVELRGFEPLTPCMPCKCSAS